MECDRGQVHLPLLCLPVGRSGKDSGEAGDAPGHATVAAAVPLLLSATSAAPHGCVLVLAAPARRLSAHFKLSVEAALI